MSSTFIVALSVIFALVLTYLLGEWLVRRHLRGGGDDESTIG